MKIAMLISGGVDSSVALRRLLDAGHEVHAFYLKIWLEDEMAFLGECPWEDDLKYARAVCEQAGVPLEVVPFQKEYWDRIVSYVIDEVKSGRTPNPDVLCNTRIKFGAFYDAAGKGFDKIATGHYAQVEECSSIHSSRTRIRSGEAEEKIVSDGIFSSPSRLINAFDDRKNFLTQRQPQKFFRTESISSDRSQAAEKTHPIQSQKKVLLKKSPDPIKDQTYFLSQLSQEQIAQACFPIGHLTKKEVRILAEKYELPNAKRKDSQGICFLGKIAFDKFLEYHLGKKEGDIVDWKTGKKLGTHHGFWFYTIGQRRNIRLSGGPWYVVEKNIETNTIFVSNHYRSEEMFRDTFEVGGLNWISGTVPQKKNLSVKLRHGEKEYSCAVSFVQDGNASVTLTDEMDKGIAAGQFAVFYDGEYCLGGGVII